MSGNSPFDRFKAGDKTAMSESAQRGYELFKNEKKANCETCHVGHNFTDENYNNIGVGMGAKDPDLGYYKITKLEGHKGAFKTPTLREIASTAPYMHDGSEKTLEEVVEFYDKGGHKNKWLSTKIKPLHLTKQEKQDLVEFLKSLVWRSHLVRERPGGKLRIRRSEGIEGNRMGEVEKGPPHAQAPLPRC